MVGRGGKHTTGKALCAFYYFMAAAIGQVRWLRSKMKNRRNAEALTVYVSSLQGSDQ